MKSLEAIERQIQELEERLPPELDNATLGLVIDLLDEDRQQVSWNLSRITVAIFIVFILALVGLRAIVRSDPRPFIGDQEQSLEELLTTLDVSSFGELSETARLLAIARVLGDNGSSSAIAPLQLLADTWTGDPSENPYLEAISRIRERLSVTSDELHERPVHKERKNSVTQKGMFAAGIFMGEVQADDVDTDLVGWWKFDERNGVIASDSSGYGHHGRLVPGASGFPEWRASKSEFWQGTLEFHGGMGFGEGDYVDCGASELFNITDQITMAMWVRIHVFHQRFSYILSKGEDYMILRNNDTPFLRAVFDGLKKSGNPYFLDGSNIPIDDGAWHHIVATYDSSTGIMSLYTDGKLEASKTTSGKLNINYEPLIIGMRPGRRGTNVEMDDVRLYRRALQPIEVKELYNLEQLNDSGMTVLFVDATASTSYPGHEPENTVNRSGLDALDHHSTRGEDTWLGDLHPDGSTWIQFEFDKVTKLKEMGIWNHNTSLEFLLGLGIQEVSIEYSGDGVIWTSLGTYQISQGPSKPSKANTVIPMGDVEAKLVRMYVISNWGGTQGQCGLSEVRFKATLEPR